LTLPWYFHNLTRLIYKDYQPSFTYLSGTPQQFLPAIQPFVELWYPPGEFVFPPLAKSNQGGLLGFLDYKNYKIRQSLEIMKSFPKKLIILIGDSSQFDAEAYATVYERSPENIFCIWIRIVEGYAKNKEAKKNSDSRFAEVIFSD
jgi:phosphatidate phosphatase APP1